MELIEKYNLIELKKIIQFTKYKEIMIVSGSTSFFSSKAQKIIENLTKNKNTNLFLKKKKVPDFSELKSLINKIKICKPNLIIAIGGGAVLDLSKVANSLYNEIHLEKKIKNNSYNLKNFCDLLAIPMTAGTGAEVTTNAVIYINNIKYSVEGKEIKPKHMALIPELIITNKKKDIISSSAFDCFAQSIESMFSKKSNNSSLVYTKKSIELFLNNYQKFKKTKSYNSGYLMSLASYYSGKAISISKTIAPHAVSYPFTSHYDVNHGHAVSLTFEEILKFNYHHKNKSDANYDINKRYYKMFEFLKVKNIEEFDKKVKNIKKDLNLESKLSLINKEIPKNFNTILKEINSQRLNNNPVKIEKRDLIKIFQKIT